MAQFASSSKGQPFSWFTSERQAAVKPSKNEASGRRPSMNSDRSELHSNLIIDTPTVIRSVPMTQSLSTDSRTKKKKEQPNTLRIHFHQALQVFTEHREEGTHIFSTYSRSVSRRPETITNLCLHSRLHSERDTPPIAPHVSEMPGPRISWMIRVHQSLIIDSYEEEELGRSIARNRKPTKARRKTRRTEDEREVPESLCQFTIPTGQPC